MGSFDSYHSWEADWQPSQRANRQEGEALGLHRISAPTNSLGEDGFDLRTLTNGCHQRRIASPPTAKNEPLGPRRQNVEGLPNRAGGEGRQGRGGVSALRPSAMAAVK